MELPNEDTKELSKDGFDGLALNVILQGRKGQIGTFSTYLPIFLAQSSFIGMMSMLS